MPAKKDIGAIVLCGGESRRMGSPKAFLKINEHTLLENTTIIYLAAGIEQPVIILNHRFFIDPWLPVINKIAEKSVVLKNQFPEEGRTFSIKLGLELMNKKSYCFIQNIDNPDISYKLLHKMIDASNTDSYIVPTYKGKSGHPVLISKTIMLHLSELKSDKWILKDELKKFKQITVHAEENNVLLNLNTEADWQKYQRSIFGR